MNPDGSGLSQVYDHSGTTELRARLLRPRALPPVIADTVTQMASALPPTAEGPYDTDGTFVFDDLNVYFNAPVDVDIVSAPPVGSASKIRFFIDHQRTSPGSFPNLDWPVLLKETVIDPDGSVREENAPANVPLFEQIRSKNNLVPFTGGPNRDGAAHVAGMNYGRPGTVAKCVGCHAGHTMIPLPEKDADARWTNLAPGAMVTVSSTRDVNQNNTLIDRRAKKGEIWRTWTSANGQSQNQWVQLTFPAPVVVKTVRLYNVRPGDEASSTLLVTGATVRLFKDKTATNLVATANTGALSPDGTDVAFNKVKSRVIRIQINGSTGTFYGMNVAGLAEIEVIARAAG